MPFSFSLVALQHVSNLPFDFLLFINTRVIVTVLEDQSEYRSLSRSFVPILKSIPEDDWSSSVVHGIVRYTPYLGPDVRPPTGHGPDSTGAQTGRPLLVTGEVYHGLSNVIHVWQFLIQ